MKCPFCEADQSELVSQFGSQLLFSQYRCRTCLSYFEGLREDLRDDQLALTEKSPQGPGARRLSTDSPVESPLGDFSEQSQPRTPLGEADREP